MYLFDEENQPYYAEASADALGRARNHGVASPRSRLNMLPSSALVSSGMVPNGYWESLLALGNAEIENLNSMIPGNRVRSRDRGSMISNSDILNLIYRLFVYVIRDTLQGFSGPEPIYVSDSYRSWNIFMPADAAVLRYLSRVASKIGDKVTIVVEPIPEMTQIETVGGFRATLSSNHSMHVRIQFNYRSNESWTRTGASLFRALRKVAGLREVVEGVLVVAKTLSRKIISVDGSYGELPKFPIVNFPLKYRSDRAVLGEHTRNDYGGANKHLFFDKSVYSLINFGDKAPIIKAVGNSGEYQWIQPQQ